MKDDYATIVAGCLAAFDALKRGETHERANKMMTRTAARIAAFKPDCPTHLLPIGRQPFTLDNPASGEHSDIGTWYDGMTGRFGVQRND